VDNKTLVLLSKFSVSARKVIGSVNPAKLINDREYCTEIFQKVAEFGDEELIILSLEVQTTLGLVAETVTGQNTAKILSIKPPKADEEKYIYGARG
jgi:hypothetical protein